MMRSSHLAALHILLVPLGPSFLPLFIQIKSTNRGSFLSRLIILSIILLVVTPALMKLIDGFQFKRFISSLLLQSSIVQTV